MTRIECPYEQDVLDAVATSRWPDRASEPMRLHVRSCTVCGDLVDAVGPLLRERDIAWSEVRVPSAGTVWWRAQLRARQEAVRVASRPMTCVQAVAALATIVAAAALVMLAAPAAGAWVARASDLFAIEVPRLMLPDLPATGIRWWVAVLAAGAWLMLAPVAIYLTLTDE